MLQSAYHGFLPTTPQAVMLCLYGDHCLVMSAVIESATIVGPGGGSVTN